MTIVKTPTEGDIYYFYNFGFFSKKINKMEIKLNLSTQKEKTIYTIEDFK